MPRNEIGSLRRSQIVGAHGPGAIVDFRAAGKGSSVSVVVAGLEEWDDNSRLAGLANAQTINEPRLEKKLDVHGFRLPPVAPEIRPGVPVKNADMLVGVRFPTWLQCPSCQGLQYASAWSQDAGHPGLYCGECSDEANDRIYVVPVRFIMICPNGHLDEFPWRQWIDHAPDCPANKGFKLRSTEAAGLAGLILVCKQCKREKAMEGCFDTNALGNLRCRGRRPWLPAEPEPNCEATPRVVQRGASNIYFPVIHSALDIPPWSDTIQKKLGRHWSDLVARTPEKRRKLLDALDLHEMLGMTFEALLKEVEDRVRLLHDPTAETLRWEEYCQFTKHRQAFGDQTEFEIRPQDAPPELAGLVERVCVATRLREVRAIDGFTRVTPPAGEHDPRVAKIYVRKREWLPAIENRGEGIFLTLDRDALASWEGQLAVLERARAINDRYKASVTQRTGSEPDREITPRFLLTHGFSHALIRQLALDCGYSSASLRERLYVGSDPFNMCGLLIYTATADSDGTLGGLARQGQAKHLVQTVEGAIRGLRWCSSDPLCIEGKTSLSHQLNGSACHACLLASETSCEEFNILLDRALLVGTSADPGLGYFSRYLDQLDSGGL